ncbi:hypothetical protein C5S35_15605, partial [Candidatus Methanophagaceae archaeon]
FSVSDLRRIQKGITGLFLLQNARLRELFTTLREL